jgi:hypothetical protein
VSVLWAERRQGQGGDRKKQLLVQREQCDRMQQGSGAGYMSRVESARKGCGWKSGLGLIHEMIYKPLGASSEDNGELLEDQSMQEVH